MKYTQETQSQPADQMPIKYCKSYPTKGLDRPLGLQEFETIGMRMWCALRQRPPLSQGD